MAFLEPFLAIDTAIMGLSGSGAKFSIPSSFSHRKTMLHTIKSIASTSHAWTNFYFPVAVRGAHILTALKVALEIGYNGLSIGTVGVVFSVDGCGVFSGRLLTVVVWYFVVPHSANHFL